MSQLVLILGMSQGKCCLLSPRLFSRLFTRPVGYSRVAWIGQ
jgi:hypothetical protein